MSKARTIVITALLLVFLSALVVQNGATQEHGGGKAQMKEMKGMEGMKGMKHMGMGDAPIVPCMQVIVKSTSKRPKGSKKGKVVILKPENGAVIKGRSVKVVFDIPEKGDQGNHVHLYLDGRCKSMIRSGRSYVLSGLREGKHKINLRLVTMEHEEYGPSAIVEVMVKPKTRDQVQMSQMNPGMEMQRGGKMEMVTQGIFKGVGKVIALLPEKSQIVVDHKEIPGFMAAMTMGYSVKPVKLLHGLKPGEKIRFTIDAEKKAIVAISRMKE